MPEADVRGDRPTHVFVYGTLKPGECNHDRYCSQAIAQERAFAFGQLFALPSYPAMTVDDPMANHPVYGWLLRFRNAEVLKALDELEDYQADRPKAQNEYDRQKIQTFNLNHQPLGLAWVYVMESEQAKRLGVPLPKGEWTGGYRENE
jgi:gamma-glutamylcyclotransferase (GGCT)/AIG2-like uncharacterized protein YtfP